MWRRLGVAADKGFPWEAVGWGRPGNPLRSSRGMFEARLPVDSVNVTVRFFATYRQITGLRETKVRVDPGATLGDLLGRVLEAYPSLSSHQEFMLLAVNQEFADLGAHLEAGDEVALLPPVSGGGDLCWLQQGPIDEEALVHRVRDVRSGAVVLFLGTVRADPGVAALDYEAYETMAVQKMNAVRSAAKEKWGISEIAIVHRTGRLTLGETSVAIACSAPHRQEAFRACQWAIEELKQIVPIWKTEKA